MVPLLINILDDLFLSPSRAPWDEGDGVVMMADSPYFTKFLTVNVERKSYLRNNYGADVPSVLSNSDAQAVHRCSYGTASGKMTHGIHQR